MARQYTSRVVEENDKLMVYIDIDGEPIIGQPGLPGKESWDSREQAETWAASHIQSLISYDEATEQARLAAEAAKAEQDALILQAKEDSKKIEEIHQMLAQLTNINNS